MAGFQMESANDRGPLRSPEVAKWKPAVPIRVIANPQLALCAHARGTVFAPCRHHACPRWARTRGAGRAATGSRQPVGTFTRPAIRTAPEGFPVGAGTAPLELVAHRLPTWPNWWASWKPRRPDAAALMWWPAGCTPSTPEARPLRRVCRFWRR